MREVIEFGSGRQARRSWGLADIGIVPARRARSSQDVDVTWKIDAYEFDFPLIAHPTDATMSPESVIEFGKQGGLGVLNAEGLWARHADPEAAIAAVVEQAETALGKGLYPAPAANKKLQELHQAPIVEELLAERIGQIRESGVTTAARVSPQHARALTPLLVKAGVELLVIQGTLVSADYVEASGEAFDMGSFISELEIPVIVGGVLDYNTAMHLMRTGAAGVIVGAGPANMTSAYGIDVGLATAIADVAAARRDYLDETGGRYVHIIADGGDEIETAGDIVRAIACGADAVALGSSLAAAKEAPAGGWFWPSSAAHPKYPRGAVLNERQLADVVDPTEAPSLQELLFGPSHESYGVLNMVGGLTRAMAKCGYTSVKAFQRVELTIRG